MRILLQQKETGLYFKDVAVWTPTAEDAMDFMSSMSAIEFCVANKLQGLQIVLKFAEQSYDIVVPIQPSSDQPGQRAAR